MSSLLRYVRSKPNVAGSREIRLPIRRLNFHGQGMVEFALVIPLMLFSILGVFEFGRLLFLYVDVASATREAARYGAAVGDNGNGSLYYKDCSGIKAAAVRVGAPAGINTGNVDIHWNIKGTTYNCSSIGLVTTPTPVLGSTIQVSVSVPFSPIFFGSNILPVNLTSQSQRSYVANVYGSN